MRYDERHGAAMSQPRLMRSARLPSTSPSALLYACDVACLRAAVMSEQALCRDAAAVEEPRLAPGDALLRIEATS